MEFENSDRTSQLERIRHEIILLSEDEVSSYIAERKKDLCAENAISGGGVQ